MAKIVFHKAVCKKCQFFIRYIDIDGVRTFLDAELVTTITLAGEDVKGYRPHTAACLANRTRAERLRFRKGGKG